MKLKKLEKNKYSWIKNSDFFKNIDIEEKKIKAIYCTKFTKNINEFLDTIHFWGVYKYPPEFYKLILETKPINRLKELYELSCYDKKYRFLIEIINVPKKNLASRGASYGFLDFLEFCYENKLPWNEITCENCSNNLECIKFVHDHGCAWNKRSMENACYTGNIEVVIYLNENKCPWDQESLFKSILGNNLNCLKYLCDFKYYGNMDICEYAAYYGNLDCLKFLHEIKYLWNGNTFLSACENGYLECLKYLHVEGCPYNKNKLLKIVECSECLEYIEIFM